MYNGNLIWIDLEMTGLDPEKDRILEIATLITDNELSILSEGPVLTIYQPESQLLLMDEWNVCTHSKNGLLKEVRSSNLNECDASVLILNFFKKWVSYKASPICGNSVAQDRRFLLKYMSELESYFSYRYLDVSTIKELMMRWRPDLQLGLQSHKKSYHRALEDIRESVSELRYYREYFIKL